MFILTLCITCFSFIPIIFPKFLLSVVNDYQNPAYDAYEIGKFGPLVIIINIFLVILLLFFKYGNSSKTSKLLESISKYEISRKTTIVILVAIFIGYVYYSWDELFTEEYLLTDYYDVKEALEDVRLIFDNGHWNFFFLRHVLLKISIEIFGNIRILPFISSCTLLLFTYLFTREITKKRLSGVLSMIILLQSNLFLLFDTLSTYETFWITFYLVSIYVMLKKPRLSFILFIMSLLTKALSALFLPISLYLISQLPISGRAKLQSIVIYTLPFLIALFILQYFDIFVVSDYTYFNLRNFWTSISSFAIATRFDGLILSIFFPTILGLYLQSKGQNNYSTFLLFSISIMLITPWILHSTIGYTNQPYRLISLVVFFAISFGTLFRNKLLYSKNI
jgi:hypothetical protein